MKQSDYYQYYVEGEDEKKLLNVLKTEAQWIIPGKVEKHNVVEKRITKAQLMALKRNTTVVLVFDTDTGNIEILKQNIEMLKKCPYVDEVICVTQVLNLEDELVRACCIKQIKGLTGSKSNHEFKRDFISESNLFQKLKRYQFNFAGFWDREPPEKYGDIENKAEEIKTKKAYCDYAMALLQSGEKIETVVKKVNVLSVAEIEEVYQKM